MQRGFWEKLAKPIIGLAPMDGVTDAPFRLMNAKYGRSALSITEFTSVEGICAGAVKTLQAFLYDESERPVVAQVFGSTPEAFYKVGFVIAELGFDGIDINMGCPAHNVASKSAGAGLILDPPLAKKIIAETKRAAKEWAAGKKIETVGLPQSILEYVENFKQTHNLSSPSVRKELPVSVKTRLGYDSIIIEEWVKHLLEQEPVNITLHGRTLKQMYSGAADWDAIAKAAKIIHQSPTTVLGNGDIQNLTQAHEKITTYGVDGALIGRAAFGNPWLFQDRSVTADEKFSAALEHAELYEKFFSERLFFPMRKHLAWYCKGFPNASEIRQQLMFTTKADDVKRILEKKDSFQNG